MTFVVFSTGRSWHLSEALILMTYNYSNLINNFKRLERKYNWQVYNEAGLIIGLALYSFESINTIVNSSISLYQFAGPHKSPT